MTNYQDFTDQDLITFLTQGNRLALDELYERYWKILYNETYKRLNKTEIVEDIIQNVFSDLWNERETKVIENIYSYMINQVRFQVYTNYKKGKSTPGFEKPLEYLKLSDLQVN